MLRKYLKLLFFALLFFVGCGKDEMSVDISKETLPNTDTVVIEKGDVLSKTFEQTKIENREAFVIMQELKKYMNINRCKPDEFYEITYSSDTSTWTNFKYFPEGKYYYELNKSTDNVITSQKMELPTSKKTYEIAGTIESSLWQSMSDLNVSADVILAYADVFAWQIDFLTDTRQGDKFKLIFSVETMEKKQTVIATEILAGQYITATTVNTAIQFINSKGDEGYFDETGKSVKRAFLKAPLQFKRISSYFTKKRYHPILKYYRAHEGIDYAAPIGTPVSAIGDGVVTKSQYSGGYGNLVIIKHPNGYESYYGHLSKYGKGIKKGVRVKQGQVIGYVGATGLATGPHLDFRIKKNGKFFNYLTMKMPPSYTLTGKDKENFESVKNSLLEKLNNL